MSTYSRAAQKYPNAEFLLVAMEDGLPAMLMRVTNRNGKLVETNQPWIQIFPMESDLLFPIAQ